MAPGTLTEREYRFLSEMIHRHRTKDNKRSNGTKSWEFRVFDALVIRGAKPIRTP